MFVNRLFRHLVLAAIAASLLSCAASGGTLQLGMTPDQAVQAMGQPDLEDTVADPHAGNTPLMRYAWVTRGKVATFGPDNRVTEVKDLAAAPGPSIAAASTPAAPQVAATPFDPVETPLNYLFYPIRFSLAWIGAGLNCAAEGDCRRPQVRPPYEG
jgi:hypothetical protein